MRLNQVSIKIERFEADVPEENRVIHVYADANNLYEALMAAVDEVMTVVKQSENLPGFGRKEHYKNTKDVMCQNAADTVNVE